MYHKDEEREKMVAVVLIYEKKINNKKIKKILYFNENNIK